jgi:hypothetical protein
MGRTIDTESRTAELAVVVDLEFDDEVIEYWNQPQPTSIVRSSARTRRVSYTPDLLVLRRTGPEFIQVKTAAEIANLRATAPVDWVEQNGRTAFVPADEAFALIGLPHRVVSPTQSSPIRMPNQLLLLQARKAPQQVDDKLQSSVLRFMERRSCALLCELLEAVRLVDCTPILQMIDGKELFARLDEDRLSNPKNAWVTLDPRLFVAIEASKDFSPPDTSSSGVTLPSPASSRLALARIHRLEGPMPPATGKRLRKLVRDGQQTGRPKFALLLPKYANSGNRRPRLSTVQIEVLNSSILRFYASPRRPSKAKSYRQYRVEASEAHPEYRPISRTTFDEHLARFDPSTIAGGRGGRRSANAAAGPSPMESRATPPSRPFEAASIDHCLLPIWFILHWVGFEKVLRQPWVTALRCHATGAILAIWLSLNNPSRIADAIVLRRCVRAHGRLPERIHSDRGQDFRSNYFGELLAFLNVGHSLSPPGHSRFNSPIEEVFGHIHREWLPERPGNSANAPAARSVSRTHSAKETAELTPEEGWKELLEFVDWFNNRPVGLGIASPSELLRSGLETFRCSGVLHQETPEFVISTAVDASKFKVDPKDGIRIDDRRYWCTQLGSRKKMRSRVSVRIEPEDPSVIYALVDGQWHTCKSSQSPTFQSLDSISRLAEAMRTLEGFNLKKKVNQNYQEDFTRRVRKMDKARAQPAAGTPEVAPEGTPPFVPRTVFDDVRESTVEAPVELSEEMFRNVLGT